LKSNFCIVFRLGCGSKVFWVLIMHRYDSVELVISVQPSMGNMIGLNPCEVVKELICQMNSKLANLISNELFPTLSIGDLEKLLTCEPLELINFRHNLEFRPSDQQIDKYLICLWDISLK